VAPKAIYSKFVDYDLNDQAAKFSELFGINLNKYTIDNYKANSCFMNLIVDTWHEAFEKRKKDNKRMYTELTYESLCEIVGLTYKSQDIGMTFQESRKFFDKFSLGYDVVNVYGELLDYWRPENKPLNKNVFP